jgi:hypothetical protein
MRLSFSIMALIANTSKAEITYDAGLKCGGCIKGGFNYCFEGTDGESVAIDAAVPTNTCCEDGECDEASNEAYTCSLTYSDVDYALTMCPQKQDKCGTKQEVDFEEVDEEEEMEVTGLEEGDTCTYTIKSKKGSPCFKVKDDSTIADSKVDITFVEFEEDKVETGTVDKGTDKSPKEGMPKRDVSFEDSGDQGEDAKGGQTKPARKKSDGSKTTEESVDDEKEYVKEKKEREEETADGEEKATRTIFRSAETKDGEKDVKPRPAEGERKNETEAEVGYGMPTKGRYNADDKGYKTFGTEGQGENKEGVMDTDSSLTKDRGMLISVTAKED